MPRRALIDRQLAPSLAGTNAQADNHVDFQRWEGRCRSPSFRTSLIRALPGDDDRLVKDVGRIIAEILLDLPPDRGIGSRGEIELFGEWVGYEVVREPLYDPTNERIRT